MDNSTEREIQDGIMALLWGVGIPAFHIPNRGLMDKATGKYNRVDESFVPGVPDIAAPLPGGRTLWIEVKSGKGMVSDAQAAYHAKLRSRGHRVLIARTVRVVQDELEDLGVILR